MINTPAVVFILLAVFFLVQGIMATWLIHNQLRMRRTLHRIANAMTVVSLTMSRDGHQKQAAQVDAIIREVKEATEDYREPT